MVRAAIQVDTLLSPAELNLYQQAISGIRNRENSTDLAARLSELRSQCPGSLFQCAGAVAACRREIDPGASVTVFTTSRSLVGRAAANAKFQDLARRRPQMTERGYQLRTVEFSIIDQGRQQAEAKFWQDCRDKLLELAPEPASASQS